MKLNVFLLLTVLLPVSFFGMTKIIVNGEAHPDAVIIIPDKPGKDERQAAEELQDYLQKITGVRLPVVSEKEVVNGRGFVLGNCRLTELSGGTIDLKRFDSYQIKYAGRFLFIHGVDTNGKALKPGPDLSAGTLFGVQRYLRDSLGVRWLWPGESGEYIPKYETLSISEKDHYEYVQALEVSYGGGRVEHFQPGGYIWANRVINHYRQRQRTNDPRGHAFENWGKIYGKSHPEWFAMTKNGVRKTTRPHNMCLSNSGFHDEVVRHWHKQNTSGKYSFPLLINANENDYNNCCWCPQCLAWDGPDERGPTGRYSRVKNISERYFRFVKSVSDKAKQLDSAAKVAALSYQGYFYAPRLTKLDSSVYVYLTPDIPFPRREKYTLWLHREYNAWKDSGASLIYRPNVTLGGYVMPEVWYDQFDDEVKYLFKLGLKGIVIDGPTCNFAAQALNCYVVMRLVGAPELSVEKIVNEFMECFGKAEPEIRAYHEFWRKYLKDNTERINDIYENTAIGWYFHGFNYFEYAHKIFPAEKLREGMPFLERAEKLVEDDSAALNKVRFLKSGLEHAILTSECAAVMAQKVTPENQKERRAAFDKMHRFRDGMPPVALNSRHQAFVERNFSVEDIPPNAQPLPEKWKVMPDPVNQGEKKQYYRQKQDDRNWKTASTWDILEKQGFSNYRHMWYRTAFILNEAHSEKVILLLGAVDDSCRVWVNGQYAGGFDYDAKKDQYSWHKPYELDITRFVHYNEENTLCVKLINSAGVGGIWKPSYIYFK